MSTQQNAERRDENVEIAIGFWYMMIITLPYCSLPLSLNLDCPIPGCNSICCRLFALSPESVESTDICLVFAREYVCDGRAV